MVNRLLLSVILVGALPVVAYADDTGDQTGGGTGGGGDAAAGGAATTGTPDGTGAAAAPAASRWPKEVINRPLTLPKGLLLVGPDLVVSKVLTIDATTGAVSSEFAES